MFKLYFLIAALIMALSSAHVIREAPPPESEISLETIFTIAENGLKKMKEVLLESFDAATTDDLQKKAEEHGETLLNQIKTWATNIKETTEEFQNNMSVKELREIVDNTLGGFKADYPKLTTEVTEYVDNIKKSSEKIVEQIKAIAQSDESAQIKELSEKLLVTTKESFVKIGNEIKDVAVGVGKKQ